MSMGYDKPSVSFSIGAEAANVIITTITYNNPDGDVAVGALPFYLCDDTAGATPTTAAHSVGLSASDGAVIESVANLSGVIVFGSDGLAAIDLEEAGAKTAYIAIMLPDGSLSVSGAITHAA